MRAASANIERHWLVYVEPSAWAEMLAFRPETVNAELVADWPARDWPLVSRRRTDCDDPAFAALGLPLPPSRGRHRIALHAPVSAIRSVREPLLLADAASVAPAGWQAAIGKLLTLDPRVRCFGSLAWQSITGLTYLTPTSDLDLIWSVENASAADRLTAELAAIQETGMVRIDGELRLGSRHAVQWREWASGAAELLSKTNSNSQMVRREDMFA
jgi:phosphoribosyl-dephospho-CoA transferase